MPLAHRLCLAACLLASLTLGCRKDEGAEAGAADAAPTPAATASAVAGEMPPDGAPGATPGPPFDPQALPAVVARVNGQEITREDVVERVAAMRSQMAQAGAPEAPADEAFFREMIDQLVGAHLLYGEAQRQGLVPSAAEVASKVAELKARFPSEEVFRQQLAAQGVSEDELAFDLGRTLAVQRVTDKLRAAAASSEEELRAFYQENIDQMRRPPQVRVRHILIGTEREATPEQRQAARAEAEQLLVQLRGDGDFAALATQHSDDPGSRGEGGLLPWMARGEAVPPFEQAAFALQPGQTSEVVETPFGYHILRLEEQRPAATVPFEEARQQIESVLERRKSRDLVRERVQALREQGKVEVLF